MRSIREAVSELSQIQRQRLRQVILEQASEAKTYRRSVLQPDYLRRLLRRANQGWGGEWDTRKR
jgi:hypothetical protein